MAETVRVRVDPHGPTYIDGPVEVAVDGQEPVLVDRFRVAICACRRSAQYPLCDGSHAAVDGDSPRTTNRGHDPLN